MSEQADVYARNTRTARCNHWCISGSRIEKGSQYHSCSMLFDGKWINWKQHMLFTGWLESANEGVTWEDHATPHDYKEAELGYAKWNDLRIIIRDSGGSMLERVRVSRKLDEITHAKEMNAVEFELRNAKKAAAHWEIKYNALKNGTEK